MNTEPPEFCEPYARILGTKPVQSSVVCDSRNDTDNA
jgi:hypothetical protein